MSRSQNQHNVGKRNRSENSETMSQKTTTGLSEPLKTLGPDVVLGSKSVGQVDANPSSTATLDQQRQTEPVLEEQMKRLTALFGDAQLL